MVPDQDLIGRCNEGKKALDGGRVEYHVATGARNVTLRGYCAMKMDLYESLVYFSGLP